MLDRIDARVGGGEYSLRAMSVGGNFAFEFVRFINQRFQFFKTVLRRPDRIAFLAKQAAGFAAEQRKAGFGKIPDFLTETVGGFVT